MAYIYDVPKVGAQVGLRLAKWALDSLRVTSTARFGRNGVQTDPDFGLRGGDQAEECPAFAVTGV
jgi:hypothetical protein